MTTEFPLTYPDQARQVVLNHFNGSRDPSDTDRYQLKMEDVYVVWFCKTLQNWKALVSTILPDLTYYEVTYNGNENMIYLDVYVKSVNLEIPCDAPITRMTAAPKTFTKGYKLGHEDPVMIPGEPGTDLGGATDLPKNVLPEFDPGFKFRTPYDPG
jgi:hypothetical protein